MNTLERIITEVRNHLPGVLDDVIKFELFNALDELFKTTNVWQEDILVTSVGNKTVYEIESDTSGSTIIRLMSVSGEGGYPIQAILGSNFSELIFSREMAVGTGATARVSLTVVDPTSIDKTPSVPDGLYAKYREIIVDGVLFKLMAQPSKPWSNPQLALMRGRLFRNGMHKVRHEAEMGFLYGGQRWRFPQTFATTR